MKAREAILESDLFTQAEIDMLLPICQEGSSDSSNFDMALAPSSFWSQPATRTDDVDTRSMPRKQKHGS